MPGLGRALGGWLAHLKHPLEGGPRDQDATTDSNRGDFSSAHGFVSLIFANTQFGSGFNNRNC